MSKRVVRRPWTSSITTVESNSLRTHGVDQTEMIRAFSYEESLYFLLRGRRPSRRERDLLRAVLVSHVSHGITGQSTLAVIGAADSRAAFLNALIAGFSVGAGVYHQGGLQATMAELTELATIPDIDLERHIAAMLKEKRRIMGFGHRYHSQDPRAVTLMELALEDGGLGLHVRLAAKTEMILRELKGISMNIEAACAAILLDLGFDPQIGHLFIVLGRSPMFAAVYLERLAQRLPPFPKIEIADLIEVNEDADTYDGNSPAAR